MPRSPGTLARLAVAVATLLAHAGALAQETADGIPVQSLFFFLHVLDGPCKVVCVFWHRLFCLCHRFCFYCLSVQAQKGKSSSDGSCTHRYH